VYGVRGVEMGVEIPEVRKFVVFVPRCGTHPLCGVKRHTPVSADLPVQVAVALSLGIAELMTNLKAFAKHPARGEGQRTEGHSGRHGKERMGMMRVAGMW
jgi:hypothetical protein